MHSITQLDCPLTVQCQTGSYLPSLCFWCFLPLPSWWRQRQDLHPSLAPDTSAGVLDLAHLVCGIHYIIITSSLHHLSSSRKSLTEWNLCTAVVWQAYCKHVYADHLCKTANL